MAYHSWGCGGRELGGSAAPTLLKSLLCSVSAEMDTFRQISVDYSEYFVYTDFRTLVRYRYHERGLNLYVRK